MSIVDWIEETFQGGIVSRLGQLLDVAYNIEYGAESAEQSSLNLLYLLGYRGQGQFRVFGASNEKYHVPAATTRSPTGSPPRSPGRSRPAPSSSRSAERRPARTRSRSRSSGHEDRHGRQGRARAAVLDPALVGRLLEGGVRAAQAVAIRELGMGTNSKLHLQFTSRLWRALGSNGETYADTGYQNTWEVTRAQPGTSGILVNYTGGKIGASFGSGTPTSRAKQFLGQIEPVLPGRDEGVERQGHVDFWPGYRGRRARTRTGRSGQYTAFAGMEAQPPGQLPLRRRAHLDRLPGIPERRGRDRRARSGRDPGRPELVLDPVRLDPHRSRAASPLLERESCRDTRPRA